MADQPEEEPPPIVEEATQRRDLEEANNYFEDIVAHRRRRILVPLDGDGGGGLMANSSSSSSSSTDISDSSGSLSDGSFSFNLLTTEGARINRDSQPTPDFLKLRKPKHTWFMNRELILREYGCSSRYHAAKRFRNGMYGSLHTVLRLELMYKLEQHSGCVNCAAFNQTGQLLASCSDDLHLCLWDWPVGRLLKSYRTGHRSNMFECKFLPLQGHIYIATGGRDGTVRLMEIASDGTLVGTSQLGSHSRACHKFALAPDSPHVFLSCGEDGIVYNVDIREGKFACLLTVFRDKRKMRIPLYTIANHPIDSNEFAVGGSDKFAKIYDRRQLKAPTIQFCPKHLSDEKKGNQDGVTSIKYNYNGSELLVSHKDEDIYLWDRNNPDNFAHSYKGHRNSATIKGVNFFGPRSEFVVSGSDCGNIYFWERETEAIVQWMAGDESGAVNCLEPHPHVPILATCGYDHDVKIWVPSCETDPSLEGLKSTVKMNTMQLETRYHLENNDSRTLWNMWRQINRAIDGFQNVEAGEEGEANNMEEVDNDSPPSPCSQS